MFDVSSRGYQSQCQGRENFLFTEYSTLHARKYTGGQIYVTILAGFQACIFDDFYQFSLETNDFSLKAQIGGYFEPED